MPRVSEGTKLTQVEHILASGSATLDFAVKGENNYYTWEGPENADWTAENVLRVENDDEDRLILFPENEYFTCEVEHDSNGVEIVRCK
ncbi:hypothetical protein [Halorussus halophilus]|uniref:hypothetical protein n=1 Tax=Halorussus halophilus TaxID=2650975 RepID=UPI0013013657|nr:hypothetical protein [Halorussus halophilus]